MITIDQIEAQFKSQEPDYHSFCNELSRLLEKKFDESGIRLAFSLKSRVKTLDSLVGKHTRAKSQNGISIKKSIDEIYDIVGLRVVVLYPDQKEVIVQKIKEIFDDKVKLNKVRSASIMEFGYTSSHLICSIPQPWMASPTWESGKNKKFEIQVRTLSEHIWATLSHDLFYKKENIPEELTREMSKTKALLEICDDKIRSIQIATLDYNSRIESLPYADVLKLDLNSATFKRITVKYCASAAELGDDWFDMWSTWVQVTAEVLTAELFNELLSGLNKDWSHHNDFINDVTVLLDEYRQHMRCE